MGNLIFHIDVNSAFLSWEAVYRLQVLGEKEDLREIPSAVGGDAKKRHGIILAKSPSAKQYGVRTGDSISNALKLCPELVLVPPRHDLYEINSNKFVEILKEFSPCVEQCSIDEAYCDMSGTLGLYGSAIEAANLIKDKIYQKLGFTVNVGISSNKVLAKMASDFKKPNLVHTLFPDEIEQKLWKLPVEELFYVGRATKKKLNELGIRTIGELAKMDLKILRSHFKKYADVIHSFANGIDISVVSEESSPNKGYGNSTTTSFDVDKEDAAKMVLLSLCEKTAARLRADAVKATVVAVELVNFDFHRTTHQITLLSATNTTNEIHKAACRLFDELWDGTPIRKLGVHTSKVVCNESSSQLNLFDMNRNEKFSKLDTAVDEVRERFGNNAIFRASFLNKKE